MFEYLFQPIKIGQLSLKNRIVMPAMGTNFANPETPGAVTERHKSYYGKRAMGGTGLIMLEAINVNRRRSARKLGIALSDESLISGLSRLIEIIHKGGAKVGMQLSHHGRIGALKVGSDGRLDRSSIRADEYYAASAIRHPSFDIIAKELSRDQLLDIAESFAKTAERATTAGADVIELHGAHGILLNEFLSPYTNRRKDEYGGSIADRAKFPLEVIEAVRNRIGRDVALSYRMSAVEYVENGLSIEDSIIFAKMLEKARVDIIHVSAGINENLLSMNRVIPPMSSPRAPLVEYAQMIKKNVNLPVIVAQRINTPEMAERIIKTEKADLVATGRALIADPEWPNKAREGRIEDIRICIACNQGLHSKGYHGEAHYMFL